MQKSALSSPEKITLRVLFRSQEPTSETPLTQPIHTVQKTMQPVPQTKQIPMLTSVKTPPLAPNKPTLTSLQSVPMITPSTSATQAVPVPVATPKAPLPPEPKPEYKYLHEKEAQSILKQNIVCTKNMKRLKLRGTVFLSFDLSPEGEAKRITVTQSSGSEILDEAVEQQIKALAPLLPKPAETVPFGSFSIEFKQCQQ